MDSALAMFDGAFVIPLIQVAWTVFTILNGGIFYQEFQQYSVTHAVLFCFGVFLIILGESL